MIDELYFKNFNSNIDDMKKKLRVLKQSLYAQEDRDENQLF